MGMPSRPQVFRAHGQRSIQQHKVEAEANRGSARERGYGARWDRASAGFKLAHPLCLGCEAIGRVVPATVTDHVEPHKGDMTKFWNAKRWQSCCAWHHDVVKQMLERRYASDEINLDDLWLNSALATRLTLELLPG
jgi:5-methylcytosine-specific restriction endonuclease McrA